VNKHIEASSGDQNFRYGLNKSNDFRGVAIAVTACDSVDNIERVLRHFLIARVERPKDISDRSVYPPQAYIIIILAI